MQFKSIKIVKAAGDANAHPTIPFVPLGGGHVLPTSTPVNLTNVPHITLTSIKHNYNIDENGTINIAVDTNGQEINEFKIVIEYDSSHLDIIDQIYVQSGTQIEYLDTNFVVFKNNVNVNQTDANSPIKTILIDAQTQNNQVSTISGRTVARIHFNIISKKTSTLKVLLDQSKLLRGSVNILDTSKIVEFQVISDGVIVSTIPTIIPTPKPLITKVPDTALISNNSILILIGLTLVATGVLLKNEINNTLKHK